MVFGCTLAGCFGPKGPFCQSCAMPMDKPELFGANADDSASDEYCVYCFKKGEFTEPDITMEEMIDRCVKHMVEQDIMPEEEARKLLTKYMPRMKRWREE